PVNAPAGWAMFGTEKKEEASAMPPSAGGMARTRSAAKKLAPASVGGKAPGAPPMPSPMPSPARPAPMAAAPSTPSAPPPPPAQAPAPAAEAFAAGPTGLVDKLKGSLRLGKARKEQAPAAKMDSMDLNREADELTLSAQGESFASLELEKAAEAQS